jgi:hypothetical protein
MWVRYFTPGLKQSKMEWHHKGSLSPKESKTEIMAEPPPSRNSEVIIYCREKNLVLVLGCDANSHHVMWRSSDASPRGRALLKYLHTMDIELLNQEEEPTSLTERRQEATDLVHEVHEH